jgi:hypothetical protein
MRQVVSLDDKQRWTRERQAAQAIKPTPATAELFAGRARRHYRTIRIPASVAGKGSSTPTKPVIAAS